MTVYFGLFLISRCAGKTDTGQGSVPSSQHSSRGVQSLRCVGQAQLFGLGTKMQDKMDATCSPQLSKERLRQQPPRRQKVLVALWLRDLVQSWNLVLTCSGILLPHGQQNKAMLRLTIWRTAA